MRANGTQLFSIRDYDRLISRSSWRALKERMFERERTDTIRARPMRESNSASCEKKSRGTLTHEINLNLYLPTDSFPRFFLKFSTSDLKIPKSSLRTVDEVSDN